MEITRECHSERRLSTRQMYSKLSPHVNQAALVLNPAVKPTHLCMCT